MARVARWSGDVLPLAIAFALLAIVGIATFVLVLRTQEFIAEVTLARDYQRGVTQLLTIMQDAETGQRGYLLTGEERYLTPFEQARAAAPRQLDVVRKGAALYGILASGSVELAALIEGKLDELSSTVALREAGRTDEALAIVRSDVGVSLMEAIRASLGTLQAAAGDVVRERRDALARVTNILLATVIAGLLLSLVLTLLAIMRLRRQLAEVERARTRLASFNSELEREVAARTSSLRTANDEIQRFAYIISHDLRAPLINVMGFTAELESARADLRNLAPEGDPRIVAVLDDIGESLGFITTATRRMDGLIRAILTFSRLGRRVFTPERIDMTALASDVVAAHRHQAQESRATVTVDRLPDLTSDRQALEQVLSGLLDNALKYIDRDRAPVIHLSGHAHRGTARIEVADNGRGIDVKDHARIFELFRRAGAQDRPGEGIGLAHAQLLVRRLGGMVGVASQLGRGTVFTIELPVDWHPQEDLDQ